MRVIDSHTGGEPTRMIIDGGPDLGLKSLAKRRRRYADMFEQKPPHIDVAAFSPQRF